MPKITIDENKAKRVAYYVASAFLFGSYAMASLGRSEGKEMWMGLYVEVWKDFSRRLDDAFGRKSNIEILLLASDHMEYYVEPIEAEEKPGDCITEYLLGGEFLKGCIAHKKLDDAASQEIINDVAGRMLALLKKGAYQLVKVR